MSTALPTANRIPTLEHTGGETKHTMRFWVIERMTGARVPMELQLDQHLNAVCLRIDPTKSIVAKHAAPNPPVSEAHGTVRINGKRATIVTITPELAVAHTKLCGGRKLEQPEEEAVRQAYLAELSDMQAQNPKCTDCARGAVTRKYQDKMLALATR
ncbi:MAG: hypothetical protein ABFD86_22740 [Bryobacteraceae bacterium]